MIGLYHFKILTYVDERWNDNLCNSDSSTFLQTKEFFLTNSKDHFPVFIYVLNKNDEIMGQLAIRIINTTVMYSSPLFKKILKFLVHNL